MEVFHLDKVFKTHNQQLKILRNKGLTIKNGSKAKQILEKENYYNLINGYKDLFIQNKLEDSFKSYDLVGDE